MKLYLVYSFYPCHCEQYCNCSRPTLTDIHTSEDEALNQASDLFDGSVEIYELPGEVVFLSTKKM